MRTDTDIDDSVRVAAMHAGATVNLACTGGRDAARKAALHDRGLRARAH